MKDLQPVILIDTREQRPWSFENLATEPATLDTGDYSIKGLQHLVAVERKSLDDLLACVSWQRDRFKRELQRLRAYRWRRVVCECTYADITSGEYRSKVHPKAALGTIAAWETQFDVPFMLMGSPEDCATYTERYLFQVARTITTELSAVLEMAACAA